MLRREFLAGGVSVAAMVGDAGAASAQVRPNEKRQNDQGPYKLGVAAYSYRKYLQGAGKSMSLVDFIRECAEMGSDGVELTEYYFEKPVTAEQVLKLKRTAHLWGQSVTGTPIGNTFTHPAGEARNRELQRVRDWIDVSADLGSPAIRIFAGNKPKEFSEGQARKHVIETLEQLLPHAEKRGVFLALENHGGVVAEADGLLEIVRAVTSPWLGINLDSGNFQTTDPYGDLARCAPYAVTVQYKVEMLPKGRPKEEADLPRILKILRGAGYRGFVTLEYESAEEPRVAVPRIVASMRKALSA